MNYDCDLDRVKGSDLRINVYTVTDEDTGRVVEVNLKVHGTEGFRLERFPTDYLEDSQQYVVRFAFGRDGITLFTDDPMHMAEVLSAAADALRDEHWYTTQAQAVSA